MTLYKKQNAHKNAIAMLSGALESSQTDIQLEVAPHFKKMKLTYNLIQVSDPTRCYLLPAVTRSELLKNKHFLSKLKVNNSHQVFLYIVQFF